VAVCRRDAGVREVACFILAILFLLSEAASVCPAETLVETDLAHGATGWVLNGDAHLLTIGGRQVLSLTQNEEIQIGVAWTELKRRVPSFSFIADVRVRFHPPEPGSCPADAMTMVFAPVATDAVGASGGALGLVGGVDTFTCFEINTWWEQDRDRPAAERDCASGKYAAFAFDWISPQIEYSNRLPGENGTPEKGGPKIGQVRPPAGLQIVNGGWYRYQWNADGATNTMSIYVTGLEERNKQFQKVEVLKVKFPKNPIDFEGRFGLTATTGGSVQHVDITAVRIEAPMIAPP
jgi:hypothetical protein